MLDVPNICQGNKKYIDILLLKYSARVILVDLLDFVFYYVVEVLDDGKGKLVASQNNLSQNALSIY